MKPMALLIALLVSGMSSRARAECAWTGEVESVFATMTTVTINGKMFLVKGAPARAQFIAALQECNVNPQAIQHFNQWRSMRRATNGSAAVGCFCFTPALLGTAAAAVMAGSYKDQMISSLLSR